MTLQGHDTIQFSIALLTVAAVAAMLGIGISHYHKQVTEREKAELLLRYEHETARLQAIENCTDVTGDALECQAAMASDK